MDEWHAGHTAAETAGSVAWNECSSEWNGCSLPPSGGAARGYRSSSGNRAFDEYRDETLRRLEEEQREFMEFLDRLRHAKDKAEFDQFMADRGRRSEGPAYQPQGG